MQGHELKARIEFQARSEPYRICTFCRGEAQGIARVIHVESNRKRSTPTCRDCAEERYRQMRVHLRKHNMDVVFVTVV